MKSDIVIQTDSWKITISAGGKFGTVGDGTMYRFKSW